MRDLSPSLSIAMVVLLTVLGLPLAKAGPSYEISVSEIEQGTPSGVLPPFDPKFFGGPGDPIVFGSYWPSWSFRAEDINVDGFITTEEVYWFSGIYVPDHFETYVYITDVTFDLSSRLFLYDLSFNRADYGQRTNFVYAENGLSTINGAMTVEVKEINRVNEPNMMVASMFALAIFITVIRLNLLVPAP